MGDKEQERRNASTHRRRRPTEEYNEFWIYAIRHVGTYPQPTERCGKWMVFIDVATVDDVWFRIAEAVEQGKMGDSAKVATMHPNRNAKNNTEKVVCIYTYDSDDKEDLLRVLRAIRDLGINNTAFYKEDEETFLGNYAGMSGKSPTKWYAQPGRIELLVPRSRQ